MAAAWYCLTCSGVYVQRRIVAGLVAGTGWAITHAEETTVTKSTTSGAVPNGNREKKDAKCLCMSSTSLGPPRKIAGLGLPEVALLVKTRPGPCRSESEVFPGGRTLGERGAVC